MESTLATSSSAACPVTFSHVFGQQCQLMEAGRKRVLGAVGALQGPQGWRPMCLSPVLCCNLECEIQLASDMLARHVHFKVSRTCQGTELLPGQASEAPFDLTTSFLCGYLEDVGGCIRRGLMTQGLW